MPTSHARSAAQSSMESDGLPASVVAPLGEIERRLENLVAALTPPESLREAIGYSLLGGGKRFRPLLAWHASVAAGKAFGAPDAGMLGRASLHAGAGVELVHAFSLVHDDLPAMDDDDLRRGKPTLHIHAGEAMAILAGDAMLTLAFGVLQSPSTEGTRRAGAELGGRLAGELVSGTMGMIGGQVWDTLGGFPGELDDRGRLELIHRNKTGALIKAAARMGGLCGIAEAGRSFEAGGAVLEALSEYAEAIGLIFQITDDLLDVEQSAETVGKRTGKDAEAGKLTYPGVFGVERSRAAVREQEERAMAALAGAGVASEALGAICRYLATRTR